jgi:hypothetical protein
MQTMHNFMQSVNHDQEIPLNVKMCSDGLSTAY